MSTFSSHNLAISTSRNLASSSPRILSTLQPLPYVESSIIDALVDNSNCETFSFDVVDDTIKGQIESDFVTLDCTDLDVLPVNFEIEQ